VLVHGLWGHPQDWRWVRELLEAHGVAVYCPDLPSHRSATAGLLADAEEVRTAIREAAQPVVVAGWSYGGTVISIAADREPSVSRLVYASSVPSHARDHGVADWIDADPDILRFADRTFVLNNHLWPNDLEAETFPAEVLQHLRAHPRRPVSRRSMSDPQPTAAWQSVPTTVLIGRFDEQTSADDIDRIAAAIPDRRILASDHFSIFREPDAISRAILQGLETSTRTA